MEKRITKLKNNIELAYKRNENTPRISMCLNFSLNNPIPVPGDRKSTRLNSSHNA